MSALGEAPQHVHRCCLIAWLAEHDSVQSDQGVGNEKCGALGKFAQEAGARRAGLFTDDPFDVLVRPLELMPGFVEFGGRDDRRYP